VLFADIKIENGRSAGYGTVRMRNPDDAVSAIGILFVIYNSYFGVSVTRQ
jgi:hypothetical protein